MVKEFGKLVKCKKEEGSKLETAVSGRTKRKRRESKLKKTANVVKGKEEEESELEVVVLERMKRRRTNPYSVSMAEGLVECIICADTYERSKLKKTLIQYNICQGWAHEAWIGYNGIGFYICDNCSKP